MAQIVFDDRAEGARCLFLGELGVHGALARAQGISTVFVPAMDMPEAARTTRWRAS